MHLKTQKEFPRWMLSVSGAELPLQMYEVPGIEYWELEEGLNGAFRDDNFKL